MAKVLVPLADGCEELEAVTIIDLLRRAGIEVVSAGLKSGVVKASRGVQLVPDVTLDVALQDDYDMVVLPGGMPGAAHLKDDVRILDLLKKMAAAGKYTAAICAAPMVLAEAGVDLLMLETFGYLDELHQAILAAGRFQAPLGSATAGFASRAASARTKSTTKSSTSSTSLL